MRTLKTRYTRSNSAHKISVKVSVDGGVLNAVRTLPNPPINSLTRPVLHPRACRFVGGARADDSVPSIARYYDQSSISPLRAPRCKWTIATEVSLSYTTSYTTYYSISYTTQPVPDPSLHPRLISQCRKGVLLRLSLRHQ